MMIAVPVSMTDSISINECGEVSIDNIDPDNPPTNEADFRGILLTVKNTQTGMILARQWVSKKVINERREASDAYQFAKKTEWAQKSDPWHKWYVEQSIKTAMHYAVARGWCIIDDTESLRALSADVESDLAALPAPASQGASRLEQIAETLNPTVSQDVIETTTGDPVSEFAPGETEEPGKYVTRIRKAISVSTSADALSELIGTVEGYAGGDFLDSPTFEKLQALAVTRLKEIEDAKAGGKLL